MAGFGAKVKLTVDTSDKQRFNEQINSMINQVKISNKFTVLQKDMDRVRKDAQAMLNKEQLILKVKKIDCSAAVTDVKNQLQGMLSALSVSNGVNIIRRYQSSSCRAPSEPLISLDTLRSEAEEVWSFYHCIPDPNADVERIALHNIALEKLMQECTPKEIWLILTSVEKRISQREAAKSLGISQTTYCRKVKAAKEKALRIVLEVLETV